MGFVEGVEDGLGWDVMGLRDWVEGRWLGERPAEELVRRWVDGDWEFGLEEDDDDVGDENGLVDLDSVMAELSEKSLVDRLEDEEVLHTTQT